jgi:hypothetical protein
MREFKKRKHIPSSSPLKEYEILKRKAALKAMAAEVFTLKEARTYSHELIHSWAKEL